MAYSVGMVNLGCPKNQVDGEIIMASLRDAGFELKDDAALADVALVNTCGFIQDAKQESIDEILELAKLKQEGRIRAIVVTGCLAERYRDEVLKELPEVDAVVGIGGNGDLAQTVARVLQGERCGLFPPKEELPLCGGRVLTTPSYFAYLKIAEGCDNRCSYCAIPGIRGKYRSRPLQSILEEAKELVDGGAKELILVAQDTTRYGIDLYQKLMLPELLRKLSALDGLRWIRLLYCYPDTLTDELLDTIAAEPKVVKYIDLPLQHCNERILGAMNRRGPRGKQALLALIRRVRERVPGVVLRTTLIAGFPGETEEEFTELAEFVKEARFERLGCFAYSQEEDTPAASLPGQLDGEVKRRRAEIIMEQQFPMMEEYEERQVGKTLQVLTEGFDRYAECFFGRSSADAPEIDGKVFFTTKGSKPHYGKFVKVRIQEAMEGDLIGEAVG